MKDKRPPTPKRDPFEALKPHDETVHICPLCKSVLVLKYDNKGSRTGQLVCANCGQGYDQNGDMVSTVDEDLMYYVFYQDEDGAGVVSEFDELKETETILSQHQFSTPRPVLIQGKELKYEIIVKVEVEDGNTDKHEA